MAAVLKVKFGEDVKELAFGTMPEVTTSHVLASICQSFHFGECSATFLDDVGNIQQLTESSAVYAWEILIRGQSLQLVLTRAHAKDGEHDKCRVIECSLKDDVDSAAPPIFQSIFAPGIGMGGKGWKGKCKGKGKGKGWYSAGWWNDVQYKGSFKGGQQYSNDCASWEDDMRNSTSNASMEAELEWKLVVLRRMVGNPCLYDAILRDALLANACNLQAAVDALVA